MSRLLMSRDYLMKCLGFVLLFGFISLGAIGGCSNNSGEQNGIFPSHVFEFASPSVEVQGRQLLVNGTPVLLKAIDYSPVPIGSFPPGSNIPSDTCIYERDSKLLDGSGANFLRLYGMIPETDPGINQLGIDNDIFLGLGFPILPYTREFCGSQPTRPDGTTFCIKDDPSNQTLDPTNPDGMALRNMIKSDFTDYYKRTCNFSQDCFYIVGNEVSNGVNYNSQKFTDSPSNFYSLINEIAAIPETAEVLKDCPDPLPVTTAIIDLNDLENPNIQTDDNAMLNMKFWSSNVYRGCKDASRCDGSGSCEIPAMTNFFSTYKTLTNKPVFISEYGIDAFNNVAQTEDDTTQSDCTTAIWRSIDNNWMSGSNTQVVIGGAVFEYSDEWWKTGGDPNTRGTGGFPNQNFPDGFMNESYFGLFSISDDLGTCNKLTPREVFTSLSSVWNGP